MNTAMILCAGFGTRMNEFTRNTPKPMLTVGGKPLLEYTIRHLVRLGVSNLVINLHYLHEQITGYFGDGGRFGARIEYVYEQSPLGTAGAVKNAEKFFVNTRGFLVLYGDVVCDEDYTRLQGAHAARFDAVATIVLHERQSSNSVVEMDGSGRIVRFIERPAAPVTDKKQNWVNSGLYCFNREILRYIPSGVFCDFPKDVFPKLVAEGSLYGYPLTGYRCAVDSPERFRRLQEDFERSGVFGKDASA